MCTNFITDSPYDTCDSEGVEGEEGEVGEEDEDSAIFEPDQASIINISITLIAIGTFLAFL
jgi:hypothetical protein